MVGGGVRAVGIMRDGVFNYPIPRIRYSGVLDTDRGTQEGHPRSARKKSYAPSIPVRTVVTAYHLQYIRTVTTVMSSDCVMVPQQCSIERQPECATLTWVAAVLQTECCAFPLLLFFPLAAGETHLNMQQYIRATQLPITTKFSLPPFTKPDVRILGGRAVLRWFIGVRILSPNHFSLTEVFNHCPV